MKHKPWIILIIFGICLLFVFNFPKPIIKNDYNVQNNKKFILPSWHIVFEGSLAEALEANPGTGKTGFLEIFWINHTTTPTVTYKQNISSILENWCVVNMPGLTPYASIDNFDVTISGSSSFDILARTRWNKTNAWDYNKAIFDVTAVRVNISTSGGGITIPLTTSGTNIASRNNTGENYLWVNTYWNNGGSGYYIQRNAVCVVTQIRLEALY